MTSSQDQGWRREKVLFLVLNIVTYNEYQVDIEGGSNLRY